MLFSATQKALEPHFRLVSGVVERPIPPVLENFFVELSQGELSVTGTNLEVQINVQIPLPDLSKDISEQFTISAKKILYILGVSSEESKIEFSLQEERVIIKADNNKYTLSTLPPDKDTLFAVPDTDSKPSVKIETQASKFLSLLKKTSFSMAQNDARYYLNAALLEVTGEYLRIVTTDGHRLAMCTLTESTLSQPQETEQATQVILPRKAVLELIRVLEGEEGKLTITLAENLFTASVNNKTLTTKLVEGRYPDYKKIILTKGDNTLECDRISLMKACKRAAIFSVEQHEGIEFKVARDEPFVIDSANKKGESANVGFDGDYNGQPLKITLKASYLQDIMGAMEGTAVRIYFQDDSSGGVFVHDPAQEDILYIAMPLRI